MVNRFFVVEGQFCATQAEAFAVCDELAELGYSAQIEQYAEIDGEIFNAETGQNERNSR
jgi:hypothetical protein